MTKSEKVIKFAKENVIKFNSIAFGCNWNGFDVYTPFFDLDGDYYIGLPKYILVDENEKIRFAKDNEVYEILESLPDE